MTLRELLALKMDLKKLDIERLDAMIDAIVKEHPEQIEIGEILAALVELRLQRGFT